MTAWLRFSEVRLSVVGMVRSWLQRSVSSLVRPLSSGPKTMAILPPALRCSTMRRGPPPPASGWPGAIRLFWPSFRRKRNRAPAPRPGSGGCGCSPAGVPRGGWPGAGPLSLSQFHGSTSTIWPQPMFRQALATEPIFSGYLDLQRMTSMFSSMFVSGGAGWRIHVAGNILEKKEFEAGQNPVRTALPANFFAGIGQKAAFHLGKIGLRLAGTGFGRSSRR